MNNARPLGLEQCDSLPGIARYPFSEGKRNEVIIW
nr:MAG TPA: hypothetical protein [Caudoviricetes sp.]